ncbi:response regulator [Clostridium sp. MB05]|jgi:two-component system, CitB family, response regulator MalR
MVKALIVEDDPMVALINRKYLEKIGNIKVYGPVISEEEIIELLKKETIDLIFLDVFLPQKSGIEILKSLRTKEYLVDIIMVTAANSIEDLERAFSYGIIDYLVKPFEFERFEEAFNKFKLKYEVFNRSGNLTQKEIDSMHGKSTCRQSTELPKGLNTRTLERIEEFLKDNSNRIWTLREIARELNVSNVTIKKYMDYLESIDKICVKITCGNVGRPELKYSIVE